MKKTSTMKNTKQRGDKNDDDHNNEEDIRNLIV